MWIFHQHASGWLTPVCLLAILESDEAFIFLNHASQRGLRAVRRVEMCAYGRE